MLYTVFIELSSSEDWDKSSRIPKKDVDQLIERARQNRGVSMIQVWELSTTSVVFQATRPVSWIDLVEEIDEYHPLFLADVIPIYRKELTDDDLEILEEIEGNSSGC